MPLLDKQIRLTFEKFEVKLPADIYEDLTRYGRFSDSDSNHIIRGALEYVFTKDSEFKDWKKTNPGIVQPIAQSKPGRKKNNSGSVPNSIAS